MSDGGEIVIGNVGADNVSLHIMRRWPDGSGSGAKIKVQCDGWTGTINGVFHKGELYRFAQEVRALYQDLSGTARLEPLEPNVALTLTGDGKGHITVQGVARNRFETGTQLMFRFNCLL
jgi:hypothetical protein